MSEQAKGKTRPEIKGKVLAIMPEWRNAAGTFWKQEIVVETGYRFPNPVKVSFQKALRFSREALNMVSSTE